MIKIEQDSKVFLDVKMVIGVLDRLDIYKLDREPYLVILPEYYDGSILRFISYPRYEIGIKYYNDKGQSYHEHKFKVNQAYLTSDRWGKIKLYLNDNYYISGLPEEVIQFFVEKCNKSENTKEYIKDTVKVSGKEISYNGYQFTANDIIKADILSTSLLRECLKEDYDCRCCKMKLVCKKVCGEKDNVRRGETGAVGWTRDELRNAILKKFEDSISWLYSLVSGLEEPSQSSVQRTSERFEAFSNGKMREELSYFQRNNVEKLEESRERERIKAENDEKWYRYSNSRMYPL